VNENAFGVLLPAKTAMTSSKHRQKEAQEQNCKQKALTENKKRDRDAHTMLEIHVFASSDSLSYKFVPFAGARSRVSLSFAWLSFLYSR
jgi:hypothetical protein